MWASPGDGSVWVLLLWCQHSRWTSASSLSLSVHPCQPQPSPWKCVPPGHRSLASQTGGLWTLLFAECFNIFEFVARFLFFFLKEIHRKIVLAFLEKLENPARKQPRFLRERPGHWAATLCTCSFLRAHRVAEACRYLPGLEEGSAVLMPLP